MPKYLSLLSALFEIKSETLVHTNRRSDTISLVLYKTINVFYFYSSQKEENKTVRQNVPLRRNSNPANCDDIGLIGYTLNGYYLVNSSETAGRFGVSFCQFKLPPGAVRRKGIHNRWNYYVVVSFLEI